MAKAVKKVDPKAVEKANVMAKVSEALAGMGMTVLNGEDFGMTKGTIVVRTDVTDVQIKPITPKVGLTRYEVGEEE